MVVEVKGKEIPGQRVRRLRQTLVEGRPKLSCERLKFLKEVYQALRANFEGHKVYEILDTATRIDE